MIDAEEFVWENHRGGRGGQSGSRQRWEGEEREEEELTFSSRVGRTCLARQCWDRHESEGLNL